MFKSIVVDGGNAIRFTYSLHGDSDDDGCRGEGLAEVHRHAHPRAQRKGDTAARSDAGDLEAPELKRAQRAPFSAFRFLVSSGDEERAQHERAQLV
jgi:hypothetical protein